MSETNMHSEENIENTVMDSEETSEIALVEDTETSESSASVSERSSEPDASQAEELSENDTIAKEEFQADISEIEEVGEPIAEKEAERAEAISEQKAESSDIEKPKKARVPISVLLKGIVRSKIVISALIFLLSITMILVSLFAPLANSKTLVNKKEIEIEYTGVDVFKIFYCSTLSMSDSKIAKTSLYKQTMKDYQKYVNTASRYTPERMQKLSEISKNMLFITLAGKGVDLRFETVFAAVALSAVLLTSAFMMFFSFLSLIKELFAKLRHKNVRNSFFSRQIHSLWLLSLLLLPFFMSFSNVGYWGIGENLSSFSSKGYGLSYGIILGAVFTLLVAVFSVSRIALISSQTQKDEKAPYAKKLILILLVLVMLVSLFLPIIEVSFYKGTGVSRKTKSTDVAISDFCILSDDDIKVYKSTKKNEYKEELLDIAARMFRSTSDKEALTENITNKLVLGFARNDISVMYICLWASTYVLIFMLALLMLDILRSLLMGENRRSSIRKLKIFVGFLGLVQAAFGVIIIFYSMLSITAEISTKISISVGLGPVLLIIASVLLIFTKINKESKSEYTDSWYDNADVAYAPYVVKK